MLPTSEAQKLKGRRTSGSAYSHAGEHARDNNTGKDQWSWRRSGWAMLTPLQAMHVGIRAESQTGENGHGIDKPTAALVIATQQKAARWKQLNNVQLGICTGTRPCPCAPAWGKVCLRSSSGFSPGAAGKLKESPGSERAQLEQAYRTYRGKSPVNLPSHHSQYWCLQLKGVSLQAKATDRDVPHLTSADIDIQPHSSPCRQGPYG